MDVVELARALALLRGGGVLERAIVFGSFGLALHGVRSFESVPDLDVVAAPGDMRAMVRAFIARGARVTSWREVVTDVDAVPWRGRIYTRVLDGALTIDVTYEGLDIEAMRADALRIDGVTVASAAWIERQRALKGAL